MENATQFLFQIAVLVFSVVIHEVSHGYAALALGDQTAKHEGRLTLNPIPHIDPFGSILLPTFSFLFGGIIIGWAKPVPYNPYNLKNQKWGPALVGAAGPLSNIVLAVVFGIIFRQLVPFAGSASSAFLFNFLTIAETIVILNLTLAVFNFVPIPPLDGSKVLFALLPYHLRGLQLFLERYGPFVLLFFIFFFSRLIIPVVFTLFRLIVGTPLF